LSQNSELYNYAQTGVLIRSIVSEELLKISSLRIPRYMTVR